MAAPPIEFSEACGLPTYSRDIRTTFEGALTFGIGLRDETARTAGTAHLLEHLVMARVGRVDVVHNATTSDETISFFAQGPPSGVVDFLNRVARAVSTVAEISDADVAEQKRIISTELGDDDERPGRGHLIDRFGNQSVGLLDLGSPAHRSLTRAEALAFAETWLHAGNAALSFTGPVPEGLDVSLPEARSLPPRPAPRVIRNGMWVVNGTTPVALSVVLSGDDRAARTIAGALIHDALFDTLRTERHLIYSVDPFSTVIDGTHRLDCYALDPRPENALEAATEAAGVLRALGAEGPSADAVAAQILRYNMEDEDPGAQAADLDGLVTSTLRGRRVHGDVSPPPAVCAVTADDVRRVIAGGLDSLFVTFGDDLQADSDDQVTDALDLAPAEGPSSTLTSMTKRELFAHTMKDSTDIFNGRTFRGARGAQVMVDPERVAIIDDEGIFEVPVTDLVLATYSEERRTWVFMAAEGHVLVIDLDQWRGANALHAAIEKRVPAAVRCTIDRVGTAETAKDRA